MDNCPPSPGRIGPERFGEQVPLDPSGRAARDERHLGRVERGALRGDPREAALPGGLAKARRLAASIAQAGSPGGHVRGCEGIRRGGLLQPFEPRACDRRCPGYRDRGNQPRSEKSRRGVLEPANALKSSAGEGPWSRKARLVSSRKRQGHPATQQPRATSEAPGVTQEKRSGAREIPVVLMVRGDCRHRLSMSLEESRKRPKRARHRSQALWSVDDAVL